MIPLSYIHLMFKLGATPRAITGSWLALYEDAIMEDRHPRRGRLIRPTITYVNSY